MADTAVYGIHLHAEGGRLLAHDVQLARDLRLQQRQRIPYADWDNRPSRP